MNKSIFTNDYGVFLRVLRKARQDAGLSQEQLAERLGQTQTFISKCERGERRLDVVEIRCICKAIGISFVEFIETFENALE